MAECDRFQTADDMGQLASKLAFFNASISNMLSEGQCEAVVLGAYLAGESLVDELESLNKRIFPPKSASLKLKPNR